MAAAGCGGQGSGGSESAQPTSGAYAPMAAQKIKTAAEATDPDQLARGAEDTSTVLSSLSNGRYELTVVNTSRIGFINSFEWLPPPGGTVTAVLGTTTGTCQLSAAAIVCSVALRPPKCTCSGTGGSVTIRFSGTNIYGSKTA